MKSFLKLLSVILLFIAGIILLLLLTASIVSATSADSPFLAVWSMTQRYYLSELPFQELRPMCYDEENEFLCEDFEDGYILNSYELYHVVDWNAGMYYSVRASLEDNRCFSFGFLEGRRELVLGVIEDHMSYAAWVTCPRDYWPD